MKLPQGFQGLDPTKVVQLKKSIYGLKQTPMCWFSKLSTALKSYGFTQSKPDYSHFSYIRSKINFHILIYVDEFRIASNDMSILQNFKNYLFNYFHMKDLGKLKYFLDIEVARNKEGIFLSQRKYSLDIITDSGLLGCKPSFTPIEINHKIALAKGTPLTDLAPYHKLVRRFVYSPRIVLRCSHIIPVYESTSAGTLRSFSPGGLILKRLSITGNSTTR